MRLAVSPTKKSDMQMLHAFSSMPSKDERASEVERAAEEDGRDTRSKTESMGT